MEMQRKSLVTGDRLNDLADSVLTHILSKLPDSKEVVRTSVLSTKWRSLWKSVPVSLKTKLSSRGEDAYSASYSRDLHYWRYFEKIKTLKVILFGYRKYLIKDVDLCVRFATNDANVEGFTLLFYDFEDPEVYTFPQFAYNNTLLRNLVLSKCQLNPFGDVKWSNLISLSLEYLKLTDGSMKRILSGCPNLECLELSEFYGINCLEINNVKLREVTIREYKDICQYDHYKDSEDEDEDEDDDEERKLVDERKYLNKLLHVVAHVENLELGTWCIQYLLSRYIDEDEQSRRFDTHNFNRSLQHLKTITINFYGAPGEIGVALPFKKYLLKIATVLEKFTIVTRGNSVSQDYVNMKQKLLSFPRSSPHVSVVFSDV